MARMANVGWVLLISLGGTLSAQAPTVLNLDDAVKSAVEHNLSLQRTAWGLEAKKRQADNAWSVLIPSTSFTAGLSRANQTVTALGTEANTTWAYSESAGLSLSISASILAQLQQVKLNYQSGQLTYDLAKRALEKNVRLAYSSLLLEEENLTITRETLARREQSLADARTKYKVGLASDLDVLSAQVSVETLKPSLQRLEVSHSNDMGQLKALLGLPLEKDIALEGDLNTEVEKTLNLAAAVPGVSPDVRQAELSVEASQWSLQAAQWSVWVPTLSLGWTTAPGVQLKDGATWADSSGALSIRLSYSLDSFLPWTQGQEKLIEAQESVTTNHSVLEEAKTTSALKRENAFRLIRQAVQSLETQGLNVQLAQKTYDMTLDAYHRGTKDLLALQNAAGDLSQARYDLLSQRYTLISTVLDLEYELNVPFGTLWGGKK